MIRREVSLLLAILMVITTMTVGFTPTVISGIAIVETN